MPHLLSLILSNLWSVVLIVLFFGGSIFVHELGHFLAARRRGLKIDRFSIGFGPRIFSWYRDGIEYRVSWLPLGGYVALPQLADMRGIEGEPSESPEELPPISYASKMIVAVMGAVFNFIFAFVLACIIWLPGVGQLTAVNEATTRIGYVTPTVTLPDGTEVPSPASQAGLRPGDVVLAIDGNRLADWQDLRHMLVTGAGHADDGRREAVFEIERDGRRMEIIVYPRIAGVERMRQVGIDSAYRPMVLSVAPGSIADQLGLKPRDKILRAGDTEIINLRTLEDVLTADARQAVDLVVERGGQELTMTVPPRADAADPAELGIFYTVETMLTHPDPFTQFSSIVRMTFRTFASLLNPQSDIGLSKLSGPVGIIDVFHLAAQADIRAVLWLTVLVNINLGIFNLLPIPVLDGGHMLFATIGKLRGRALPPSFLVTTQSVFMVLLFSMIIYVSFFDVRRIVRRIVPDEPAAAGAGAEPVEP